MQTPRAISGPRETMHRAMGAVLAAQKDWWAMSACEVLSVAMRATNGAANPRAVMDEIALMLSERGITPTKER